ncbi:hypothetical protein [Actinomadura decatromicini]|uniref:Uncharacterized protein n=1 Tax=Actinomadura decatromicini TaxID=2604572 RepID=A0A5D3FCU5_9ACTN|nr:hypothetical protein [Actinomadura decatromicini]TYK45929.1 hypothetical protein FXF68_27295 [Actinomadura decatromicini]
MTGPRHAREAERAIAGFEVYELPDGSWRAVSRQDGARIVEHERWCELAWACVSSRIAEDLRVAGEELAARMAEPSRAWRNEPSEKVEAQPLNVVREPRR